MRGAVTVTMTASAEQIWEVITDIRNIGRYSPETFEAEWLDGATGPTLGAKFRGEHVQEATALVYAEGFGEFEREAMEEVLHSPSPPTVNLTDTRRLGTYDELVPAAPPNPPRDMTPMEAAANLATGPKEGDAIEWHVNGSQVSRFEFHSELVYINKDAPALAIA